MPLLRTHSCVYSKQEQMPPHLLPNKHSFLFNIHLSQNVLQLQSELQNLCQLQAAASSSEK